VRRALADSAELRASKWRADDSLLHGAGGREQRTCRGRCRTNFAEGREALEPDLGGRGGVYTRGRRTRRNIVAQGQEGERRTTRGAVPCV